MLETQNDEEQEEFDITEIEFYLREMREVKNRVLESVLSCKSNYQDLTKSQASGEDFDIQLQLMGLQG